MDITLIPNSTHLTPSIAGTVGTLFWLKVKPKKHTHTDVCTCLHVYNTMQQHFAFIPTTAHLNKFHSRKIGDKKHHLACTCSVHVPTFQIVPTLYLYLQCTCAHFSQQAGMPTFQIVLTIHFNIALLALWGYHSRSL